MKIFPLFFSVLALVLAFSCQSYSPTRVPSNADPLGELLTKIEAASKAGVSSHEECYEVTSAHYRQFFELSAVEAGLQNRAVAELESLVEKSFNSRLNIRNHLKSFDPSSEDARDCLKAVRDLTRALRYFEDYAVEQLEIGQQGKEYESLSGEGSYFLKNPKIVFRNYNDLQSGDVILSRGNAYTSAAIARIGQNDAQFSHLSFVYKDENGELHTTEAHIEIGSIVAPIQTHIEQGNAREVVFRFRDPLLAHRAAKLVYEKVKEHSESKGKNIQYDFSMNYQDNKRLFCSEVVYDGFAMASAGEVGIPLYKTKFAPGLIPFLQKIGIQIDEENVDSFDTFAPGDIEFDSRFELVAEWRRPDKLRDNRIKDAVLTKMFEWMEFESYRFRPSFVMNLKSYSAWLMRRTPFVKKNLDEKFPLNMGPTQLNTFLVIDEVGEALQKKLEQEQAATEHSLSFKEMFEILDRYRVEDMQRERGESHFHKRFRAKLQKK